MTNAFDAVPAAESHTDAGSTRDVNLVRRRINNGKASGHVCTAIKGSHSDSDSDSDSESEDDEDDDQLTRQSRPCICMNCLGRVLGTRSLVGDLAGHMFGHLVPLELAKDILTSFINDGTVQVLERVVLPDGVVSDVPVDPRSENQIQRAVEQAFEDTVVRDCIRLPLEGNSPEKPSSADQEAAGKEKAYFFEWRTFPRESLGGDELVSFFNHITDHAVTFAKSRFPTTRTKLELQHRFADPKHHPVPLAYAFAMKDEVMRPDFFLLPIAAFSDAGPGFKTVDKRYFNFTALRLVGAVNKKYPRMGFEQMKEYAEGLKGAQPWVFYTVGMTVSQNMVVLSRGDNGGWEHLALVLWDGRGSIEFIRVLLGLALANAVELGQNPFIQMKPEVRAWKLDDRTRNPDSDDENVCSDDAMSTSSCHSASTTRSEATGSENSTLGE